MLLKAGNIALTSIDSREGISDRKRPALHFTFLGLRAPTANRFPCLCKEIHAKSIATRVLEESMTKLAPLISVLAAPMSDRSRALMHAGVQHKIDGQLQLAISGAFKEIMEDTDISNRCAEHEMTHVQPWMTKAIQQHCESAAKQECKTFQWRARDVQLERFQQWLNELYLEDAEGMENGEIPQQDQTRPTKHDEAGKDNDDENCGNVNKEVEADSA